MFGGKMKINLLRKYFNKKNLLHLIGIISGIIILTSMTSCLFRDTGQEEVENNEPESTESAGVEDSLAPTKTLENLSTSTSSVVSRSNSILYDDSATDDQIDTNPTNSIPTSTSVKPSATNPPPTDLPPTSPPPTNPPPTSPPPTNPPPTNPPPTNPPPTNPPPTNPPPPTSPPPTSPPPSAVCDCSRDYNCSDFNTHNEAQSCFDSCGGSPNNNWSGLDRDHDGIACESLP